MSTPRAPFNISADEELGFPNISGARHLPALPLEDSAIKITALETALPPSFGGHLMLLRVHTDEGIIGCGESFFLGGAMASVIHDYLAGRLLGGDALAIESHWRFAYERLANIGARGAELRAISAIDVALWDVLGQVTGLPIYRLLGGPTRNKVRALAALDGTSDEELRRSMDAAHNRGFRAFQVPLPVPGAPNQGQAYANAVAKRMETLRSAAAPNTDFVVGGAGRLTPGDASRVAAALESQHVLWFDEPCSTDNLEAIRKITSESVTPVAFGRDIRELSLCQDLLREGIVDVLRPDLSRHGIGGLRQVAALAETYYTAVAPAHEGGPVGTAAAVQLAASLPNFFIQHVPLPAAEEDRRVRAEIGGTGAETVQDGFLALPSGPGFGIEVNEAALRKYAEATA